MIKKKRKKKIGLALGSGAARGLAHIGVLKVLEENNIPIDIVSGSSMGAVIGALYCSGKDSSEIYKIVKDVKWYKLVDLSFPKTGLIKGNEICSQLRKNLNNKRKFKELDKKLIISSVDVINNKEILFNKGDLIKAVRASISIPGIFTPVENNKRLLVDGGVIDPLPVKSLKEAGADIIIGVNVNPLEEGKVKKYGKSLENEGFESSKMPNIFSILLKTASIMEEEKTRNIIKNEKIDVLISPKNQGLEVYDFYSYDKIIKKGEEAARKNLKKIKKLLK